MISPTEFYASAKDRVIALGYSAEIEWQITQNPIGIKECDFLREAAWVIYCSGFKEAIVRRRFNYISLCFYDWQAAEMIAGNREQCIVTAMHALANRRKHEAVAAVAQIISTEGFEHFWSRTSESPTIELQRLPYIGPITAVHLAKNLGFDVAKPDRHLVKLKERFGFGSVDAMCTTISGESGDPVRVVDLVLWRFLERRQSCEIAAA
ncbi:hypothetical protein LJR175_001009 [Variovorax sp. LjRoot175]|uniref:hypothetical protein n=1 Tax=Variovorax sp. LjRoot175 TaxID=3342276 RepID=UPI003ECD668F